MGENIDALINNGIIRLNDAPHDERETLLILGLPRSGTSFISSALANLGVFLGDKASAPTYEDKFIKDAFDNKDASRLEQIVSRYNSQFDLWGIKLPRASHAPLELLRHLRSPRLLVTLRDPLAIALRMQLSQGERDTMRRLRRISEQYCRFVGRLEGLDIPSLFISYDKVAQEPELAIRTISGFCGILDEQLIRRAIERTREDSRKYLDEARVNKAYGIVEESGAAFIRGWAIYQAIKGKGPPEVEVWLNDKLLEEVQVRSLQRNDLGERGKVYFQDMGIRKEFVDRNLRAFDGWVGFEIHLGQSIRGMLRLKVAGDDFPFFERKMD